MSTSRSLMELHPECRKHAQIWLDECDKDGLDVLVTCTYRDPEDQAILFRKNRSLYDIEQAADRLAKMGLGSMAQILLDAPPQKGAKGSKTTNAPPGLSYHQRHLVDGEEGALGIDFVVINGGKLEGEYDPDDYAEESLIKRAGEIAESCGLRWCGNWPKAFEWVHVQWDDGGRLTMPGLALGKFA